jgi:hypothetical protein
VSLHPITHFMVDLSHPKIIHVTCKLMIDAGHQGTFQGHGARIKFRTPSEMIHYLTSDYESYVLVWVGVSCLTFILNR